MNVERIWKRDKLQVSFQILERVGVLIKKLKKLKWAVMESLVVT